MGHFDHAANDWDSPEKIRLMGDLAAKAKKHIKIDNKIRILDFGCGTGLFGLEFFDYAKQIVGVDLSVGMLKVFSDKTKDHKHISSFMGDIGGYRADHRFELILSSMTFHHLEKPEKILVQLRDLLADGGQIAVVDLVTEDGTFHKDNAAMGVNHFGFSQEEVQSWANHAGMNVDFIQINQLERDSKSYSQFLALFS